MLQKTNIWRVLRIFFRSPTRQHQIRQISREAKLATTSVANYLKKFVAAGLIQQVEGGIYLAYAANRESEDFRIYKKIDMQLLLEESGLLEYIDEECAPKAIFLFGSASRGEDTEASDVDLFIQAKEKDVNLGKFEKQLGRKINIFFEPDFDALSPELKNNILNGLRLRGFLGVRWKK